MTEQFIITADKAHLRVFQETSAPGQLSPGLSPVLAMDFPEGKQSYTARDASMAGRFQGSKGRPAGMSIDERLPMKEEYERRVVAQIAGQINAFLLTRPHAEWRFAAPESIEKEILRLVDEHARRRLVASLPKDLVNLPAHELLEHFATAETR